MAASCQNRAKLPSCWGCCLLDFSLFYPPLQERLLNLDPYRLSDALAHHVSLNRTALFGTAFAQQPGGVTTVPTLAQAAPSVVVRASSTGGGITVNGASIIAFDVSCATVLTSPLRQVRGNTTGKLRHFCVCHHDAAAGTSTAASASSAL